MSEEEVIKLYVGKNESDEFLEKVNKLSLPLEILALEKNELEKVKEAGGWDQKTPYLLVKNPSNDLTEIVTPKILTPVMDNNSYGWILKKNVSESSELETYTPMVWTTADSLNAYGKGAILEILRAYSQTKK